ncbi:MAG: helix-turn-helix domain-containing protein [Alphaproteobacteria bacterium]|nr:helix-turn-helix domain-containing protein [Alphaproteobacteria bacterium]
MKDNVLTVRDVAEMLKLAEKTVYSLVADGEIPGFKVGGSWRFSRKELENWIEAQNRKAKE